MKEQDYLEGVRIYREMCAQPRSIIGLTRISNAWITWLVKHGAELLNSVNIEEGAK